MFVVPLSLSSLAVPMHFPPLAAAGSGLLAVVFSAASVYWIIVLGKRCSQYATREIEEGNESADLRSIATTIGLILYGIITVAWIMLIFVALLMPSKGSFPGTLAFLGTCKSPSEAVKGGENLAVPPSDHIAFEVDLGDIRSLHSNWKLANVKAWFDGKECKVRTENEKSYNSMIGAQGGDFTDEPNNVHFGVSLAVDVSKQKMYTPVPVKFSAELTYPEYAGYGQTVPNFGHRFRDQTETREVQINAVVVTPREVERVHDWNTATPTSSMILGEFIFAICTALLGWLVYWLSRPDERDVVWKI